MKLFAALFSLPIACLLTGCGANYQAKVDARNDLIASRDAYKECLSQHPDNVSACQGYKLAYQTDLQTFSTLTNRPPQSATLNINNSNGNQ